MSGATRWGSVAAVVAAVAATALAAPAAGAPPTAPPPASRPESRPSAPVLARAVAPAAPAWRVDGVRFEPLAPGGTVTVAGVGEYPGVVDVVRGAAGAAVVNEVALDDYVRGIAEVPTSWPAEAQKAQAIAARTYALYVMGGTRPSAFRAVGADICATQACQVYLGVAGERRAGAAAWDEAVRATAGQVLLYGGRPIRAKYSASNGGATVAGGAPYLPAQADPHDAAVSPYTRWRSPVPIELLAALFPAEGELVAAWSAAPGVVLGRHLPDGTAAEQIVSRWDVRRALNGALDAPEGLPVPVPSPLFEVGMAADGRTVVLDGRGYGHGVGMSQYGALGKARSGWSAAQIVAAYYGGIWPAVLPPGELPATIRVAVDLGRPSVALSSGGGFRVVAGDGTTLAHAAGGTWRVRPVADGVEVQASEHARRPVSLAVEAVEPSPGGRGHPMGVRFALSAPAVVRVGAAGEGQAVDLGLFGAGAHRVDLPPDLAAGAAVVLQVDAGGGRRGWATLALAPPPPPPEPPPPEMAAAAPAGAVGTRTAPPATRAAVAITAALLAAVMGALAGSRLR